MKTFKTILAILAILLFLLLLPLCAGFSSLDGTFCPYGNCREVTPFWEPFLLVLAIEGIAIGVGALFFIGLGYLMLRD